MKFLSIHLLLTILLSVSANAEILEVKSSTPDTISSQTYVLMVDMKHVTPPSGDYLLVFSTSAGGDDVSDEILWAIFKGGTIIQASEREVKVENSIDAPFETEYNVSITYHINVSGSEDVEIRWKYTAAAGKGAGGERSLILYPEEASKFSQVASTDSPTMTSDTYVAITTTTITAPGAADYLMTFTGTHSASAASQQMAFAVFVGGTILQHTERQIEMEGSWNADGILPIAIFCKVSPTAGQDVDIRWKRVSGTATHTITERAITLVELASENITEVSATGTSASTSTTDELINSMDISSPGAADWVAFFGMSWANGSITVDQLVETSFYVNDVREDVTSRNQDAEDSFDTVEGFLLLTTGLVSPTAGQDVDVRWKCSDTVSRTARDRTFVMIREASAGATGRRDRIRLSAILNEEIMILE